MSRSISIILPVKNVEDCLAERVRELLEVISEFSPQIELLIVDDRSSDGTNEIANELTRIYPQVRLIRHDWSANATKTALQKTYGDIIFIHANPRLPLSQNTLKRLWEMREREEASKAVRDNKGGAPGRRTLQHLAEKQVPVKAAGIPTLGTPALFRNDSLSHS